MLPWFRRNRSDEPRESRQVVDPIPTAEERRDELLSAFLDDELSAADRAELEARLASDADMREALDGMRVIKDTLATLEVVRAPRSFAIAAPPTPSRQPGLRRFDLVARVGAMAASVAFVAVLAGDLTGGSGNGSTPITEQLLSAETAQTAAPDGVADSAASESMADLATTPEDGSSERAATDSDVTPVPDESASPGAADNGATPATPPTADPDSEPTVGAAAASAELNSTQVPGAEATAAVDPPAAEDSAGAAGDDGEDTLPARSGGGLADAEDDPAGAPAPASGTDGTPATGLLESAVDAGDTVRDDGAAGAGTADDDASLGSQSAETFAAIADGANSPSADDREVSDLTIGLGVIAVALAAVSGALWWRRRDGAAGPV